MVPICMKIPRGLVPIFCIFSHVVAALTWGSVVDVDAGDSGTSRICASKPAADMYGQILVHLFTILVSIS